MNYIERDIFVLCDASCVAQPIEYVQGTNAVPILLHIRDYDIPSGSMVRVYVEWPSTKGEYDAATIEGNDVYIDVKDTMFSEIGKCFLQLCIVNGENTLVTFSYPVVVKKNHVPGIAEPSKNKSDFLDEYMKNLDERMDLTNELLQTTIEKVEEVENNTKIVTEKANSTAENAMKAQSYAVGGTDTRENEDIANAKFYYEQTERIAQGLSGTLLPCGTITFEELTDVQALPGYMFNISNEFVADDRFMHSGILHGVGANIYLTKDGKWDVLAGSNVVSVNGKTGVVILDAIDIKSTYHVLEEGTEPPVGGNYTISSELSRYATEIKKINSDMSNHVGNESNPHKVNKTQVGLENVPNVATDDQTPTFSIAATLSALVSGEKLSVSFGKIAKAIAELISHIGNKSNPHGVTKAQVGLGSVDNTADSAKSVKYAATAGSASKADNASYATSAYALSHSIGVTIGRTTKNTTWGTGLSFSLDDIGALPLSGGALSGWISIPNNSTIYSLTSTGESVRLIDINSSNNMHINNGTVKTDLYLHSSGKQINFNASAFFPNTAKDTMLGTGNKQWGQIYSSNATISTSDRNAKDNIKPLSDIHKQFFMKLIPVSFTFKDGASGRTHIGFISQDVERAMEELGMSSLDFAGFCRDVKTVDVLDENGDIDHEEVVLDENGNPEYIYSLRYEEFIALIAKVVQDVVHELEDTKKDVAEIKSKLTSIESTLAKISA